MKVELHIPGLGERLDRIEQALDRILKSTAPEERLRQMQIRLARSADALSKAVKRNTPK